MNHRYPVNPDDGSAKFDKSARTLTITLPVSAASASDSTSTSSLYNYLFRVTSLKVTESVEIHLRTWLFRNYHISTSTPVADADLSSTDSSSMSSSVPPSTDAQTPTPAGEDTEGVSDGNDRSVKGQATSVESEEIQMTSVEQSEEQDDSGDVEPAPVVGA